MVFFGEFITEEDNVIQYNRVMINKGAIKMFKNQKWMMHGLVLGIVFFLAIFLVKPIGVSTQFSVVSGMIHSMIDPSVIEEDPTRESGYRSANEYYDKDEGDLAESIKHPINYEFIFVLAIPLGAFIGYLLLEMRKKSKVEIQEQKLYIPKQKLGIKAYLPGFLSGFLILYGARMAGGCTSGHMMSGIMQGSISGFIFMISVFAFAVPTALMIGKKTLVKGDV